MNNFTKQQFQNRQANFSTHGSRRGYSDLGEGFLSSDNLPLSEKRAALVHNKSIALGKYRDDKTKENLAILNCVESSLSKVNAEIKEYNLKITEQQEVNKGRAFMDVARKVLDRDVFKKILQMALDEHGLRGTSDQHTR